MLSFRMSKKSKNLYKIKKLKYKLFQNRYYSLLTNIIKKVNQTPFT